MKLFLFRQKHQPSPDCTLGKLIVPDANLTLFTMERPWIPSTNPEDKGGVKFKSCVPVGEYRLERHDTTRKPRTWALVNHHLDVVHQENDDNDPDEDRATCLIHVANFARQLEGCIAPGLTIQKTGPDYWVTSSVRAMNNLRGAVPWTNGHTLTIEDET